MKSSFVKKADLQKACLESLGTCRCGECFTKTSRNYGGDFLKFLRVHSIHGGVSICSV